MPDPYKSTLQNSDSLTRGARKVRYINAPGGEVQTRYETQDERRARLKANQVSYAEAKAAGETRSQEDYENGFDPTLGLSYEDMGTDAYYKAEQAKMASGGGSGGVPGVGNLPASKYNLPGFAQESARLQQYLLKGSPYQASSSYTGDWRALIGQLQQQASGQGPSLASQQYARASQDAQSALGSMARGSTRPGAARSAMTQQASLGQGLAAGSAQARTQEQLGAQAQLQGALSGASSDEFRTNTANQQAWLQLLQAKLGINAQQLQAMMGTEGTPKGPSDLERGAQVAAQIAALVALL